MKMRSSEKSPAGAPRFGRISRRKSVAGFVLALAGCALATACGSSSSSSTSSSGAGSGSGLVTTSGPASGDIQHLNWALPVGEPDTIDPRDSAYYSSALVADNLCDTLVRQTPQGTFVPNVASWKLPNSTTLIYNIKPGIKFWDGKPLTSADVAYSLQRAGAPDSVVGIFFAQVKSITATGPLQVTVKFKQPDELFNKEMSIFVGGIVEKAYAVKAGKDFGTSAGGVMCSGPFKLDKWTPGQNITLTRNDNYWNPAFKAHAATVTLQFVADSTALAQGLISGELDGAWEVPAAIIPRLKSSSDGRLFLGPARLYYSLSNLGPDTVFSKDPNLMTALLKSLDRNAIAEKVFNGAGSPNFTLLAQNTWDAGAKDLWANAYKPYVAERKYDLAGAKKLVQQSSYDGSPIVLMTQAGDATQSELAQLIQEQGKQIGLNITIKALQPAQFAQAGVNASARKGLSLGISPSFNGVQDPVEPIGFTVGPASFYNYVGYNNAQASALFNQAAQTYNTQARVKLMTQLQSLYEKAAIGTSFVDLDEVSYLNNKFSGMPTSFEYMFEPSLALIGAK